MTVATTSVVAGPYAGNDVATAFAYTWRIESKTEVTVIETDSDGVETVLTVDTDYTVAGIGTDGGGSITRVAGALPTGSTWDIVSAFASTQETDFQSQGSFLPETHEAAMDKLTFLHQQLASRALQKPGTTVNYYSAGGLPVKSAGNGVDETDLVTKAQLSAANVTGFEAPVVTSIMALKALDTSGNTAAFVLGYTSPLDGGGGVYRFDAASVAADNNGTVIAPDVGSGRWRLAYTGMLSVNQFGATGDGVTDDRTSFSDADGAASQFMVPPGTYSIQSNITLTKGYSFQNGAMLKPASGVTITISGPIDAHSQIFDLSAGGAISLTGRNRMIMAAWFGMDSAATAAANKTAFDATVDSIIDSDGGQIVLPPGKVESNSLSCDTSGVDIVGHWTGTWLINATTNAPAIELNGGGGTVSWSKIRKLRIGQKSGVSTSTGNCGVRLINTDQCGVKEVECFPFPAPLEAGFLFNNADNNKLYDLTANGCDAQGFDFRNGCTDTFGNTLVSYSNGTDGFYFSGVSGFYANDIHAYGNDQYAYNFDGTVGNNQFFHVTSWIGDTSGSYNWRVANLNRSSFGQCWAATQQSAAVNTFATGVIISGAASAIYDLTFNGMQLVNNNSHGALIQGGCKDIQFIGGRAVSNGQGGVSGEGMRVELATEIQIHSMRMKANLGFGILTTAVASDYLSIQGNIYQNNTGGTISNGSTGANNSITGNI